MATPLSHLIAEQVEQARALAHRLVLLVGPPRCGRTTVLRDLHEKHGWPLVNLNRMLSQRLLDLAAKRRALRTAEIVDDIVREQEGDVVLLDNIEMLFHPDLQQHPLRLLQSLSRNRTIVAAWRGQYAGSWLVYAAPDHPEFCRFEHPEALIVPCGDEPGA